MQTNYIFNENDIKKAIKEKYLDENKAYSITLKEVEAENYYGETYKTIVAEAIEL